MTPQDRSQRLLERINKEVNLTFTKGALVTLYLAVGAFFLVATLDYLGNITGMKVVLIWIVFCAILSLAGYILGKREIIKSGWIQYSLVSAFVSTPSIPLLVAEFTIPWGTASYITGPPTYLYFVAILLTGSYYNRRLSTFAGALAGAEYFGLYLIAYPKLMQLELPDPLMAQDMTAPMWYFLKAVMMLIAGMIIGFLSDNSLKQLEGFLKEEEEKERIDRLFGQYVAPAIKDRIVAEQMGTKGESKEVVVLFADIRDFTGFCETHQPQQVVDQLNEYFDAMVGVITVSGGVVDKFIGDAIMANFGGLYDLKNRCAAAFDASQKMRDALVKLNQFWAQQGKQQFRIGIGLHQGYVLQGPLGSQQRREYTLIGDTVNIAARLESLTKELKNPLLISEEVYNDLTTAQRAQMEPLGSKQVKGKKDGVWIYGLKQTSTSEEPLKVS
ncbi:MAG: hypothetical protein A2508_03560 [Candidatus Lambdaproteobacteria bacterium RIFOXYD12_FULL_49_8]|uniref:Guanylate cyclase domain-containing protein n=1 Tax=Candidatus Lambdaproteobacteria bacterium RIFOXYD2_FULL_50_16 TaxID=1817772 RepID=A0A1F6GD61_9PROT|nr:MAG: hypothetical protein A2527_11995 [Candidatus Lambdaproteobacteria bacterium RIFOXYD2_FULL_50_16]OGG96262.1 MAG: hypothetical protein A2508_03560 [Candidatus Lambdaproteobacteria bacterium RIFOXYD12_FULL_49_8]